MVSTSHNRWRSISASICLLAVLCLYTPLATTAWTAYRSTCCASGQCPIKEHHHHQAPAASSNQMDCGHDMAGLMACSMSCCHNQENPAVASAIFVLPLPFEFSAPASLHSSIEFSQSKDSLRSVKPLSPPPRSVLAAAYRAHSFLHSLIHPIRRSQAACPHIHRRKSSHAKAILGISNFTCLWHGRIGNCFW